MKCIWIHGAPAVGKLTVAKQLHKHHGYKLFHNHLATDISLAIYDEFGEKDFFDFTNQMRRTVLLKAYSIGVSHLVMTHMACAEYDSEQVTTYLTFFAENGIDVYPIHLCPSDEVILERSVSADRINTHKLSSKPEIQNVLNHVKFLRIEHENLLSIDNSTLSPEEVAQQIIEHVK